jgi:biotin carboxylase
MKKALLVDTSFSSAPLYQSISNLGIETHVVGGNPDDYLAKIVSNYHELDYSDSTKLLKLIKKEGIDYVVPGCNDLSYKVCAEINQENTFPGIDNVTNCNIINDKYLFRDFASINNLPTPKVFGYSEKITQYPVIVKPVDAFSGKGVTVVHDEEELPGAIDFAKQQSSSARHIVEEYFQGQLFSHSAFVTNGKVKVDFIVEEHGTVSQFAVDTSRVDFSFSDLLLNELRTTVEKICELLLLKDGLIHTQFNLNDNNQWKIIEITRRCPGDLYSELIRFSSGYDYPSAYIKPFIGEKVNKDKGAEKIRHIIRHTITSKVDGYLDSIRFLKPCLIKKWVGLKTSGQLVKKGPPGRVGVLFLSTSDYIESEKNFDFLLNRELYELNLIKK